MPEIGIIDYGMGNLRSVEKGFERVGIDVQVLADPDLIRSHDGLVLPGVGAFGDAMRNLKAGGFVKPLLDYLERGGYLLGICLGMQVLLEYSEEHGKHRGLGIVPGRVKRLPDRVKVPHMGWNAVDTVRESPLLNGIPSGSRFYFVHSFHCEPFDSEWSVGLTPYGIDFTSALGKSRIWGVQFHPEKSSMLGLRVLRNFGDMVQGRTDG